MSAENYASDVKFLKQHTQVVELTSPGAGKKHRVAVAPQLAGRVMTSCLEGPDGASFGWLNRRLIASGKEDEHFNNYGGEDRFWLGPEGGQFALWFAEGEAFETTHWKTPAGFDRGGFTITSQGSHSVVMATHFDVTNYSGTTFHCAVRRTISTIGRDRVGELLGATPPDSVRMVAFSSNNTLVNAGGDWTRDSGLVSIWILGQFKPLPHGKVIVPFIPGDEKTLGPAATTDYFGPLADERCRIADDHLLFTCDGQYRSKIGIAPARARNVLGSYDPDAGTLTLVQFNLPGGAAKLPYVNSLWKIQDHPFAGDVVNSYNDGEEKPGAGQLGPFYEIETSSPAADLTAGEAITHIHRTFHFAGEYDDLNKLAVKVLGVELNEIAR